MNKNVNIDDIVFTIGDILKDYQDTVYIGTDRGLDVAQKVLINNLKISSPRLSGEFRKSWKGKKKKGSLVRYVGNTKTVKGKKGDIPLSNILEYGADSPHQGFIKDTYRKSIDEMANAVIIEIEKGV